MKFKILMYPLNEKRHSLYNSIINLLSKKYDLIYDPKDLHNTSSKVNKFKNKRFRIIYYKYLFPYFSISDIKRIFKKKKIEIMPKADLIYSSNKIPPGTDPYIIDIENISALNGYSYGNLNKESIKKELESERCKAIICWNEGAKESIIKSIKSEKIIKKITTIPFSIKSDNIKKKFSKNPKFLFVSSLNNPDDFDMKGGEIALECFKILKKYNKNITLSVRANVPEKTIKKYSSIDGINFLRNKLDDNEMKKLFLSSDILIEPLPGLNLMLDCFNHKVSIICFDFWFMKEMIKDGENGILVESDKYFCKYDYEKYLKDIRINFIRLTEKKVIDEFALKFSEKAKRIINNIKLREKFANNSKKLLSKGNLYNIERRDKALLKLFDKSISEKI